MSASWRLVWLYARSRRLPWTLAGLAVLVGLTRWGTHWPNPVHDSVSVFASALAAVLLVGSIDSPGAEMDYGAPLPWNRWRAIHILGGLVVCIVPLAMVVHHHGMGFDLMVARDVLGFTGLAAITAAYAGAALSWIAPMGYAFIVWVLPVDPLNGANFWLWPVLTADVAPTWLVALVLASVGGVSLTARGVPLRLGDPDA